MRPALNAWCVGGLGSRRSVVCLRGSLRAVADMLPLDLLLVGSVPLPSIP